MKFFSKLIVLLIALVFVTRSFSQELAIKSNLLYDATGSMNLGVEFGLSKHLTLDISGNYNPWTIDKATNSKIKHLLIQPELRYWHCEKFNGHFFGLHAHYGYYNIGGDNWLTNLVGTAMDRKLTANRYDGWVAGGGFSYGYHWIMNRRWALEGTVGFGYAYIKYNKYDCTSCGQFKWQGTKHYFGPTKVGLSLIFMIK